ncbi:MAG: GNAT family N-acetyltransferase [Chloroflexi bacterium]|nr:GNAT family N-acetyltransferase [Chloroflexota bacterium]
MREADLGELPETWSLLQGAGPHRDYSSFYEAVKAGRSRVLRDDDPLFAAVVGRWREQLPIGWIQAFSFSKKSARHAESVAAWLFAEGYEAVISPPVDRISSVPFRQAKFARRSSVLMLANDTPRYRSAIGPAQIAPLRANHVGAVLALERTSFDDFWRYGRGDLDLLFKESSGLVALLNGRCVGYNILSIDAGRGLLARLAVDPEHRRVGVGRQLVETAANWFLDRGASCAMLTTQRENGAARALYESCGFRKIGEHFLFERTR